MFQNAYNKIRNVSKCFKMLQNASKCFKMLQNVSKCFKMVQNASKCFKMFQNASKCFEMLQNGSKCSKMLQNDPKSTSEGSRTKKQESAKTSNTSSSFLHVCDLRGSKIHHFLKSGVEKEIKIECDFGFDFWRIWEDFGTTWDPKSSQNGRKTAYKTRVIFR